MCVSFLETSPGSAATRTTMMDIGVKIVLDSGRSVEIFGHQFEMPVSFRERTGCPQIEKSQR
jgi:hypothetical protein